MSAERFKRSLFIFRRDLRLADNTGLIAAIKSSDEVLSIFIFDPRQIGQRNEYRSDRAIEFMVESLHDLQDQLGERSGKLHLFYGDPVKIVKKIVENYGIDALFLNIDYTPFSRKRDEDLVDLCKKLGISLHAHHDALLIGDPAQLLSSSGKPYMRYTPFARAARLRAVPLAQKLPRNRNWYTGNIEDEVGIAWCKKLLLQKKTHNKMHGGRSAALMVLKHMSSYKNYSKERDMPAIDRTTHLSAAHKFGTISIRESYQAIRNELGVHSVLIAELYWRDFFTYLAFHFPHVFGHAMYAKYDHIQWSRSNASFRAWCEGRTGFPIVDAGMRQLNETGWMHNRVRMIVASFLVKDLHINWRWGERYFAQKLIDYDPAVNNGNWQWVASTGADAQPYFRIFNPWLQQKKFDPECVYIKQWVSELDQVPIKDIHAWYRIAHEYREAGYPKPIAEHSVAAEKTLKEYQRISKK